MEDILALRLFLAIAETSSFTQAARRLSLTTAVASRKMAALEAALGQRLFLRSTRRVSLTEQGAFLRQHAQRVVDAVDEAGESMRGALARPAGRLRISCRAGLASQFVVPYLAEFRATYPEVSIGLELVHERLVDLMGSGCDVALTIGQLEDSNLVARRIAETDSQIYASPDYLAAHGTPTSPQDLEQHTCLTMSAMTGTTRWKLSRAGIRYEVPIHSPLAIDNADALLSCACAGLGIVLFADWFVTPALRSGALVPILSDYQVEPRGTPINVLYQSRSYVPLKVRAFIDFYSAKAAQRFAPRTLPA
jgi:DNA-binding transcriptional LysR family regulator